MPRRSHPEVPGHVEFRRRFGRRIRELRRARDLTQTELGGGYFERGYVSAVELGAISPSLPAILHLSRMLRVSLSELFEGVTAPRRKRSERDPLTIP